MLVGDIFERVGIDLTGPHPRSRKGNVFILTYVDYLSKWAEAVPLPNKEMITVAKALIDKIFCRLGLPRQILSDQGREFDNALLKELCAQLGIDKIRTSSYKPSTNGATERFHRTLNSMFGRVIEENQKTWCEWLPSIMSAYRSARHESTGYTPNFIVFGCELTAPIDIVFGRPEGSAYESPDEFVEEKLRRMEQAHNLVREHFKTSSGRRKTYYDNRVKTRTLNVGSWVWYYSPRRYVGRSPKWQRNFSGPFLITKQLGPVLFAIQRAKRAKEMLVHADKLKPFLGEPPESWVARTTVPVTSEVQEVIPDEMSRGALPDDNVPIPPVLRRNARRRPMRVEYFPSPRPKRTTQLPVRYRQ